MACPAWTAAAQQYPAYSPNTQCTRSHKGRFVGLRGGNPGVCTADLTSATAAGTTVAGGSAAAAAPLRVFVRADVYIAALLTKNQEHVVFSLPTALKARCVKFTGMNRI